MESIVKQEIQSQNHQPHAAKQPSLIDVGSSSSDSNFGQGDNPCSNGKRPRAFDGGVGADDDEEEVEGLSKRQRMDEFRVALPVGFLDPLPLGDPLPVFMPQPVSQRMMVEAVPPVRSCKQFWKAGDYEEDCGGGNSKASTSAGIDHLRIHPKFLHSNATSHKWALGAFAELLDNSLDEAYNGATYVHIDALENKKDGGRMLLIEDNGGGMDPNSLRQCMSLGYSMKGKLANTIGQYGNGFKTSTMRLGADVIVFTQCHGKDGKSQTQSIGMLSYTFLRSTRKEDTVVPMLHYEKEGITWNKLMPTSPVDWKINLDTIVQWSPYSSEADLLLQFNSIKDQGTRIIIYNLWEDDEGQLELDFGFDKHDIQIRGVNRDETKIQMAKQYPNSRHYLTYRHSLRSYASILYLRLPRSFRIILRGKDIDHHCLVDDMMLKQEITYRPQTVGVVKPANICAVVTVGFVKDAKYHIDIQGFNVYHKNRLIKPFWRVWNATGSGGRGIIGVLEANFVEPAHDKQGFERTTVLSRLETKLIQIQKNYWNANRHRIGYASSQQTMKLESSGNILSFTTYKVGQDPEAEMEGPQFRNHKVAGSASSPEFPQPSSVEHAPGMENGTSTSKFGNKLSYSQSRLHERPALPRDDSDHERGGHLPRRPVNGCVDHKASSAQNASQKDSSCSPRSVHPYWDDNVKEHHAADHILASNDNRHKPGWSKYNDDRINNLEEANRELRTRINEVEKSMLSQLQLERDRTKLLEAQLRELAEKLEQADKEQEALVDIFSEERTRRDKEEGLLRNKLKDSSASIQELLEKAASNTKRVKLEP